MTDLNPSDEEEIAGVIRTGIQANAHFVVSAWVAPTSPLVDVLTVGFDYPPYNRMPVGVGGLSGRAGPRTIRGNPYDKSWYEVWKRCDEVNEGYETGTFLPSLPVTLLPAFMIRPPFKRTQAESSIDDVFKAHSRFACAGPILFFETISERTHPEVIAFVEERLAAAPVDLSYVRQVLGRRVT